VHYTGDYDLIVIALSLSDWITLSAYLYCSVAPSSSRSSKIQ